MPKKTFMNYLDRILHQVDVTELQNKSQYILLNKKGSENFLFLVEKFLATKYINICDDNGYNLLMYAIIENQEEYAKLLVKNDINIDKVTKEMKETSIMLAVKLGNKEMIEYLIERGANPNLLDINGNDALYYAINLGNKEIIDILNKGIVQYEKNSKINEIVLMANDLIEKYSYNECLVNYLNFFIDSKDVNVKDGSNYTLLMVCVSNNLYDFVKLLLKNGADPNVFSNAGTSALILAIRYSSNNMLELLLEYGANPNLVDNEGVNAIDYAISINRSDLAEIMVKFQLDNENLEEVKRIIKL